jgi:hypothetical protein
MKHFFAGFALATALCSAAPLATEPPKPQATVASKAMESRVLRAASRIAYNAGAIDLDKPLAPQALAAVATPEPNANFLIGVGLLGVAYLLQARKKQ